MATKKAGSKPDVKIRAKADFIRNQPQSMSANEVVESAKRSDESHRQSRLQYSCRGEKGR